ncbi:MAG: Fe-S cluster assembly sulfur transfer protein SufU [bacterium]
MSLYQQAILNHSRNPHNFGRMPDPTVEVVASNPVCGDEIVLQLRIEKNHISQVRFEGKGCSISQASASLMSDHIMGKSIKQTTKLCERFKAMLTEGDCRNPEGLEELQVMQDVRAYPVRVKCALLAWDALRDGIAMYQR